MCLFDLFTKSSSDLYFKKHQFKYVSQIKILLFNTLNSIFNLSSKYCTIIFIEYLDSIKQSFIFYKLKCRLKVV